MKVRIEGMICIEDILESTEIKAIIDKHYEDYDYIGVRIQETPEDVGTTITHLSHVWEGEEDTGDLLDGVCAVDVEQMERISELDRESGYFGTYAIILGANYATYGDDAAEIVMRDPEVLGCIKAD